MKVSFDFDQTLDKPSVQTYAKSLVEKGVEVWVHTSRFPDSVERPNWNRELYEVCSDIGIENVVFCEMADKYLFLKGKSFLWHLDDDWVELDLINKCTDCVGISVFGNSVWKNKCNKLLI